MDVCIKELIAEIPIDLHDNAKVRINCSSRKLLNLLMFLQGETGLLLFISSC